MREDAKLLPRISFLIDIALQNYLSRERVYRIAPFLSEGLGCTEVSIRHHSAHSLVAKVDRYIGKSRKYLCKRADNAGATASDVQLFPETERM